MPGFGMWSMTMHRSSPLKKSRVDPDCPFVARERQLYGGATALLVEAPHPPPRLPVEREPAQQRRRRYANDAVRLG
jgi:hypothetical protein